MQLEYFKHFFGFYQNCDFPTRCGHFLDLCFSNVQFEVLISTSFLHSDHLPLEFSLIFDNDDNFSLSNGYFAFTEANNNNFWNELNS